MGNVTNTTNDKYYTNQVAPVSLPVVCHSEESFRLS
jgi:hypothetical protein